MQSRKELSNQNNSIQNTLKTTNRKLDHANEKLEKFSEIVTGSNNKILKSVGEKVGEKVDEKLEPLYERMDQLYELCISSNSTNNGYIYLRPQQLSLSLNTSIFLC